MGGDWVCAIHESAHCIVAYRCGIRLKPGISVSIVRDEASGRHGFVELDFSAASPEACAAFLLAGGIAAGTYGLSGDAIDIARHLQDVFPDSQHVFAAAHCETYEDLRQSPPANQFFEAVKTLCALEPGEVDAEDPVFRFLLRCADEARRLVTKHQPQIEGLAALLIEKKTLTGDQVEEFLNTAANPTRA